MFRRCLQGAFGSSAWACAGVTASRPAAASASRSWRVVRLCMCGAAAATACARAASTVSASAMTPLPTASPSTFTSQPHTVEPRARPSFISTRPWVIVMTSPPPGSIPTITVVAGAESDSSGVCLEFTSWALPYGLCRGHSPVGSSTPAGAVLRVVRLGVSGGLGRRASSWGRDVELPEPVDRTVGDGPRGVLVRDVSLHQLDLVGGTSR